jgi:alkanesulfonate monooxygenase SsuD/methylene tetrahydromethanopterin reductase-like flavin-dependent oxidoreductase (luciferase family)
MVEPQLGGTYDDLLRIARLAEDSGMVSLARSDHLTWDLDPRPDATDAFATIGGLARETSRIRLCVLVSPITFRHPAIIAKNAATIDQMSGGRLDLGMGTGWNDFEHEALGIPFPESAERWTRLEESLAYLTQAFGDGVGRFDGEHYQLDLDVRPKPEGLRIVVGGSGMKRTPRLAGTYADEHNFFICPPDVAAEKIANMRAAAGDRAVEVTVMAPPVVGSDDAAFSARVEENAAAASESASDYLARVTERGWLIGAPGQVQDKIAELEEAGVDRVYIQWLSDLSGYDGLAAAVDVIVG